MQTIIDWIDPKVQVPPFDTRILVLLGGQGSRDVRKAGRGTPAFLTS